MLCEYYLNIAGSSYLIGEWCVANWDEISYAIKRDDYGGTTRSFTSKFDFTLDAYDLILNEYLKNYVKATASISLFTIDDNHVYKEEFTSLLDFGTLKYSGGIASINTMDKSLATLIKANKNTQYEYLVSDLKEEKQLSYDRLQMSNTATWLITGETEENEGGTYITNTFTPDDAFRPSGTYYAYPLYITGTPEIAVKNIIEVTDAEQGEGKRGSGGGSNCPYIFKNISSQGIKVNVKVKFYLFANSSGNGTATLRLRRFPSATDVPGASIGLQEGLNAIEWDLHDILVNGNGGYISFLIYVTETPYTLYQMMPYASNESLTLDFMAKDITIDIDAISPSKLLNKLLQSIAGEGYTGEIASDTDDRLDNALLLAAESIRGIDRAKIYSSFGKFQEWMSVMFGFVPIIDDISVRFVHRDSLFSDNDIIPIGEEIRDFGYSVNDKLIYSSVRAGFEKKDYDSVNGRDEFHWINEFVTGLSVTDNTLELKSPFRADAYGIEFLAQKRDEKTRDSDSDSDVFFVYATFSADVNKFVLVRSGFTITGVISPDTMFNAAYSPRSIIEANKRFIGVSIDKMTFASSDGNSDVSINGVNETDDIIIAKNERLFTVGEVVVTSANQLTANFNIPVEVENDGKKYICYPAERSRKYGRYDGMKHTLYVKSISPVNV